MTGPLSNPNSIYSRRQLPVGAAFGVHSGTGRKWPSQIRTQYPDHYSQYALLFIYANIISSFYTELRGDGFVATISGFNLWSTDIAVLTCVPMVLSAIRHRAKVINAPRLILLFWLSVLILTLTRGILISPFYALFNFRAHAAFCAGVFAFSLRPVNREVFRKLCWAFICAGIGLAVIALMRRFYDPGMFVVSNLDFYLTDRPILSPSALIIGEAVIFSLSLGRTGAKPRAQGIRWNTAVTLFLIAGLLVSGQRTAAIATAVGVTIIFISWTKSSFGGLVNPFTIFGGLIVAAVVGTVSAGELLTFLPTSFFAGDATGDFQFRLGIWNSILQNFASWSPFTKLFGMADSWAAFWYLGVGNVAVSISAHNELLGVLLIGGVIGVALLVVVVTAIIAGAVRAQMQGVTQNSSGLSPALTLALLAILMIYGVTYEWLFEQGFILAICAAGWPGKVLSSTKRKAPFPLRNPIFRGAAQACKKSGR